MRIVMQGAEPRSAKWDRRYSTFDDDALAGLPVVLWSGAIRIGILALDGILEALPIADG